MYIAAFPDRKKNLQFSSNGSNPSWPSMPKWCTLCWQCICRNQPILAKQIKKLAIKDCICVWMTFRKVNIKTWHKFTLWFWRTFSPNLFLKTVYIHVYVAFERLRSVTYTSTCICTILQVNVPFFEFFLLRFF